MKLQQRLFTLGLLAAAFLCHAVASPAHAQPGSVPTTGYEVHPDLDSRLFAAEPMLFNPTDIDVDHLGRVWVCEAVNYRNQIRNGDMQVREAGDRIVILEDSDGDGKADKQTVFYQGRDIDSAHGICVLGDRALISVGDSMFFLIDTDGDSVADEKQVLFTGISGTQHDHGIHAAVFGPDGKLYFNFGNEGKQICDAAGKPVVDLSGHEVKMERPYQGGMIFRCNLDGSQFETLAWNFRNNWEVCVDSFGRMWQSDNDDDGNRGVRINYVIPFGNYGYTDEITGAGWNSPRTNLESEIPLRHWHLNDPGVVPNLLQTGGGSPTGICAYEGQLLPEAFQGQVLHTDAGPNIVRAYPVKPSGAGYSATIINIMDGAKNSQWFRPSDICVAPDGSVFVADWCDPGVGGHRMQDIGQGRIYRITPKTDTSAYTIAPPDFSTPDTAALALTSPNLATRYLAWKAIEGFGDKARPSMLTLAKSELPRLRARALWTLGRLWPNDTSAQQTLLAAAQDNNPELRAAVVRIVRELGDHPFARAFWDHVSLADESPLVRSELAISLSHRTAGPLTAEECVSAWGKLARQYQPGDRWGLEVLGIAAEDRWDACLSELQINKNDLAQPEIRDLVWRSRGAKTLELLAEIILRPETSAADSLRYFRAFDFQNTPALNSVLRSLTFSPGDPGSEKQRVIFLESALRLTDAELSEAEIARVGEMLNTLPDSKELVQLVDKFAFSAAYPRLLTIAAGGGDAQIRGDAVNALFRRDQGGILREQLMEVTPEDEATFGNLLTSLTAAGTPVAAELLAAFVQNKDSNLERRRQAVSALGRINRGAQTLLGWAREKSYDGELEPAIIAALHGTSFGRIRERAIEIFPLPKTKDNAPLPDINALVRQRGDATQGQLVFASEKAGCAKCHIVNGTGKAVGPELSEIGAKLSRPALFESILYPSAGISHNYENIVIETVDGEVLNGLLVSEANGEVQLKNAEGAVRTLKLADIAVREVSANSLMPANVHESLSTEELVNLVAYLSTLKQKQASQEPAPEPNFVAVPAPRPNVLICIADDWSYGHAGSYGCGWVKTPGFDRVASQGLLFDRCYTPNAKCAPSRACLLTGRNSWQLKEAANHMCPFPAEFKTFPEALQSAGYAIGFTGKGWAPGTAQHADGSRRQLVGPAYQSRKEQPLTSGISNNNYVANFADFLDKTNEQPWCFWYGATEPHRGYEYGTGVSLGGKQLDQIEDVPDFFPDTEVVRNDMLDYALEVEHVDQHVVRILAELERRGELEDTLIIFTSDHGMPFPRCKGQAYDYSNHVPLAIMWPGHIEQPGRTVSDYVSFVDLAPTILAACGVTWEDSGMASSPGRAMQDLFANAGSAGPPRDHVLIGKERHDVGRPNDAGYPIRGLIKDDKLYIRNFATDRWPAGNPETGYLNCDGGATKTLILAEHRKGNLVDLWELAFGKRPEEELYDLSADPDCIHNLAAVESCQELKAQLRSQMEAELRDQQDPRVLGQGDWFDSIPYTDVAQRNFYQRYMRGESLRAGWVNASDFEVRPAAGNR